MSAYSMESPRPGNAVNHLNDKGVETAQRATELLCREAIDLMYSGIAIHLQYDKELIENMEMLGFPEGEQISFFIMQDEFTAPREEKKFVTTFSTKLESEQDNNKYMVVHVPANGHDISTFEMPEKEAVTSIFIEYHDQETHWYAIKPNGLFEYVPLARQDKDTEDILSDQGIWRWINDRIPEGLETVTTLFRNIVNWNTVPQHTYTIKDTPEDIS